MYWEICSISKIEHIYHYITSIPISLLLIASHWVNTKTSVNCSSILLLFFPTQYKRGYPQNNLDAKETSKENAKQWFSLIIRVFLKISQSSRYGTLTSDHVNLFFFTKELSACLLPYNVHLLISKKKICKNKMNYRQSGVLFINAKSYNHPV